MYNVTIIIPHYNSADELQKLLNTIPKNNKIQIIVIDDKSNKDLKKLNNIKLNYENDNILFIKNNTSKKGAGVCRNIGVENATGKWILFADSDDYFIEDFYKKLNQYFYTNFDVVFFPPTSLNLETRKTALRHKSYSKLVYNYIKEPNKYNENLLKYKFYVPWSKLIRKKFIVENQIKFDELMVANDTMFSTKIGYNIKTFAVSKHIIYCVTSGKKDSLTNIETKEAFYSRLNVWLVYYKYLKRRLTKTDFKKLKISNKIFFVRALKYGYGVKEIIHICNIFRKNNIKILL